MWDVACLLISRGRMAGTLQLPGNQAHVLLAAEYGSGQPCASACAPLVADSVGPFAPAYPFTMDQVLPQVCAETRSSPGSRCLRLS